MDFLPKDPAILVSSVNMLLRDEEFDSLESLCYNFNREPDELKKYLLENGFVYSESQKQFRPEGYDATPAIERSSIETAYSFMHQKLRVYEHSTLEWQKDDIESIIASYADDMNPQLYKMISRGRKDFLKDHTTFISDIRGAVDALEKMLN